MVSNYCSINLKKNNNKKINILKKQICTLDLDE